VPSPELEHAIAAHLQASRIERAVARSTGDVLAGIGIALAVAGNVAVWAGIYYERRARR
jgi:hypothetical protein